MGPILLQFKPAASKTTHLLVAGTVWGIVGLLLVSRGLLWLNATNTLWLLLPAMMIGCFKAFYMLEPSAQKNIRRILDGDNKRCLGGVYSWKTWLLVLLMMAMGRILRSSNLPREFLGVLYISIGWGLFFSSRKCWQAWNQERKMVR